MQGPTGDVLLCFPELEVMRSWSYVMFKVHGKSCEDICLHSYSKMMNSDTFLWGGGP